jgi:tellurium resistance protein TerD
MTDFDFSKGEVIETGFSFDFNKADSEAILKTAGVGLGWRANDDENGPVFDLDVSAFCLGEDGLLPVKTDLVYFNSKLKTKFQPTDEEERPYSTDGAVFGAIDETIGSDKEEEEGDAEDMRILLNEVADHIKEIVIVVTITKFPNDEQKDRRTLDLDFSQVEGCYCRVWDYDTDEPLCTYELDQDFGKEDAVVFGKFSKDDSNNWSFTAIGEGHIGGIQKLASIYSKR